MYTISGTFIWAPLYLAIMIYLGIKHKRKALVMLLFIILGVILADRGSVLLFKDVFQRLRPCHEPVLEGLVHIVKGKCGGMYGFVSSHAANCFYAATISSLLIRKRWFSISIICWAAIISYSRIYLGVHYPGDVICGTIFGAFMGWGVFKLYEITDVKIISKRIGGDGKEKYT
jgi:undecaprenyl-diphosphatase